MSQTGPGCQKTVSPLRPWHCSQVVILVSDQPVQDTEMFIEMVFAFNIFSFQGFALTWIPTTSCHFCLFTFLYLCLFRVHTQLLGQGWALCSMWRQSYRLSLPLYHLWRLQGNTSTPQDKLWYDAEWSLKSRNSIEIIVPHSMKWRVGY